MLNLILFVHVMSAVLLGGYIVFPYLVERGAKLPDDTQRGFAILLSAINRVGHYALMALLITGVGLIIHMGQRPSLPWLVTVVVLLVILGGIMGMLGKELQKLTVAVDAGESKQWCIRKIRVGSWCASLAIILEVFLMTHP